MKCIALFACLLWVLFFFNPCAGQQKIAVKQLAQKHNIHYNKPAPDFFEGALLGNGAMGVVVTTRPDAVVLYFGHNNVWDIRLAENHREEIKTFPYVFDKVKQLPETLANLTDDSWYNSYNRMAGDNYSRPYPRPFPCGAVVLGFDRRKIQLTGHTLDIYQGICHVHLLTDDKKELTLSLFADLREDKLLMQLTNAAGEPQPNIFNRIRLLPDPSTPAEFPKYQAFENLHAGILSFRQILPCQEPGKYDVQEAQLNDKAFTLTLQTNSALHKIVRTNWSGNAEPMALLEAALPANNLFTASVTLREGLNSGILQKPAWLRSPTPGSFRQLLLQNQYLWDTYWQQSAVQLADSLLEQTWYRNLYFLNCATKAEATCPGLFANWSYNHIGTAWHGDYHMNYNTQQPFWVTFSSNHLEKNIPYVNLVEFLLPVSRKWAKEYYGLPGAYFPHSAFPVAMTMNPYPIPDWGWEVSETPWAVQGLWWHYLYSGDTSFLRHRAYEPIKSAVSFLTAYMKRADAHGGRWQDSNYHIFPTVPPELYALRPGFRYNYDCAVDLALTKFIFKAFQQSAITLGTGAADQELLANITDILAHFPSYPVATSATYGKVLVSVPGEHDKVVYNVPNALITVFPGEDYGLDADKDTLQLLKNTFLNQQNEGGNDLVFGNLQAARIGMLNLEAFKRQITYCLLPNGTASDKVMQTGGRYSDQSDYGYMAGMGIWFENFALPAVINECLMQSYNGTIRLFPNWPRQKDASFSQLRAAGAFLVSAAQQAGKVKQIKIISEKGNVLHLVVPWGKTGTYIRNGKSCSIHSQQLQLKTTAGETLVFYP